MKFEISHHATYKMFFYSPMSASFIKLFKMGSYKWYILVGPKISHLRGFTVFSPNKICSIINENGHIIMPLAKWFFIPLSLQVLFSLAKWDFTNGIFR